METIRVQKNQIIAKQNQKVKAWYLILEGSVIQRNSYARVVLEKDGIIGVSESDRYLCDYVARQDSVLVVFPYDTADDLIKVLNGQESMRGVLLRAALKQRQMLLETYAGFQNLVRQFHSFVESEYNDYTMLCSQLRIDGESFTRMDNFKPLDMVHKAENWEVNNSTSLMKGYLEAYLRLMQKDDSLCIGAIMEASYQTRRVTQGIIEMVEYLRYNQDILLSESGNDMFHLYFELLMKAEGNNYDTKPLRDRMDKMAEVIQRLGIYDEALVSQRIGEYQSHDFTVTAGNSYATPEMNEETQDAEEWDDDSEESGEDCLAHILTYAGYNEQKIEEIRTLIQKYRDLPDMLSTDAEAFGLRKQISQMFCMVLLSLEQTIR